MSTLNHPPKDYGPIWPMLLDYSRRECYQILRRLELEAYGRVVAVFRAQGTLTTEKRKVLQKLQTLFGISSDRHKAEVRRVVNDEELATISETLCGKEATEDWITEGKRTVPIFHRPSPETAYLAAANKASQEQFTLNSRLPHPSNTALSERQLERIRRGYRLFDTSQAKARTSKPVTCDKATETTRSLSGTPLPIQLEIEEPGTEPVPRVEYEVTCETDSSESTFLQTGILNGHVQSTIPIHGQSISIRTQKQPSTPSNLNHNFSGTVLHRSPQEVSSYCTIEKEFNSYKSRDLVSSPMGKSGSLPMSLINAQSPRKRCFSATVPYDTPNTWGTLGNVVQTPTTVTGANRRTPYSHFIGTGTSPPENQRVLSTPGGPGTVRVAQSTVASVQRIQPPSLGKTVLHSSTIVTPSGAPQATRPQTPLVVQVCRSSSDSSHLSEASSAYQRIPCSSVGTLFVSARPTPSTLARKPPTTISPQASSFKSPNAGPRLHTTPPRPSIAVRTTSDPSEHGTRHLSVTPSPTISIVQSLQGISTSNRVQGTNALFIPSSDSSRIAPTSPFSKHSTSVVTVPTNQLIFGTPKPGQPSEAPSSLTTAKRLVCSTNSTMLISSSSATSVSLSSHNLTGNSIVVFQRATNRNPPVSSTPALKLGPTSTGSFPPTGPSLTSSNTTPESSGSRQIRILGVSSVSQSPSVSLPTPAVEEPPCTPTTLSDTERKVEVSVTPQSEDFIPSLLARASRLGAMLDVDLDADEVALEPESCSPPQDITSASDLPQTDAMDSESCWAHLTSREAYYTESNSPSSAAASYATPDAANSMELISEATSGLKGGQLWAILGLSSNPTATQQPEEPSELTENECSNSSLAHTNWDQTQLLDYENGDFSSEAPEPKRARLSSGLIQAGPPDSKSLPDSPACSDEFVHTEISGVDD